MFSFYVSFQVTWSSEFSTANFTVKIFVGFHYSLGSDWWLLMDFTDGWSEGCFKLSWMMINSFKNFICSFKRFALSSKCSFFSLSFSTSTWPCCRSMWREREDFILNTFPHFSQVKYSFSENSKLFVRTCVFFRLLI